MKAFVIDDHGERGRMLFEAARLNGLQTEWLRPMPNTAAKHFGERRLASIAELRSTIEGEAQEPAIWLWDILLHFVTGDSVTGDDYSDGQPMFEILRLLLNNGHVLVLTSVSIATSVIKDELVRRGCPEAHIREQAKNFQSLATEETRKQFCEDLIKVGIECFKGSLLAVLAGFSSEHFERDAASQGLLPHTWPKGNDEQREPMELMHGILIKLTGADEALLGTFLNRSAHGIFETLKTLIGKDARVHSASGRGYSPCLGVLPLLLIRALSRSGKWSKPEIEHLFRNLEWSARLRYMPICSPLQEQGLIREWLKEIGDILFPILALNHDQTHRSSLERLELCEDGRFFTLKFTSRWEGLFRKVHSRSVDAGSTYSAWRSINERLGRCGEGIGWDASCILNVYSDVGADRTVWDFRINREL